MTQDGESPDDIGSESSGHGSRHRSGYGSGDAQDSFDESGPRSDRQRISQLTRDTLALVLAGGRGSRLGDLTHWRAKPALYFGGKFRLIDFPISNCVNSGIRRVGVITQYKAHSLIRHIQRAWSKLNHEFDEFVDVLPASQRVDGDWYRGTADAVFQNIDIIRSISPKHVLILSGDHVYKMDYGLMIADHVNKGSDMMISCIEVPISEAANAYGVLTVDDQGRVLKFTEKPEHPDPIPGSSDTCLASMGNYVFDTTFLYEQLIFDHDSTESTHDFGHDVIPRIIEDYQVYAYRFANSDGGQAYWRDVGTIDSYWAANMELIEVVPELDMYDLDWRIMTYQEQLAPAKFVFDDEQRQGIAVSSLVSGGCVISGATVRRSLLFSRVIVHSFALIEDSVVLPHVDIGRRCRLRRCIVDAGTRVPPDTVVGEDPDEDRRRGYHVTDSGLVLLTARMFGQNLHWTR